MAAASYPSNITIRTACLQSDTFAGFQGELLDQLVLFAKEDNVTLHFDKTQIPELHSDSLALIAPECRPGESAFVDDTEYSCDDFDMIVGDYWTSPIRYTRVDFTPPWLTTSIAALKFTDETKSPNLDVTTLDEAQAKGAGDSTSDTSSATSTTTCVHMLKAEECALWVSDELVLGREQSDDPSLEFTGEYLQRQLLAWPVRKSLDPTIAFLLNKWMYAANSNQTIMELYDRYFQKKSCPIGRAGKNCELPCVHGIANAAGKCVCESTRFIGDDCNTEVPEELNMISPAILGISYAMYCVNLLVVLLCAIWLFSQRKSPQVQVSSPFFLGLVLLGTLISSSTIVAMAQEDEGDGPVPACMAIPWLYSVGFSVTFGALFGKVYRVYQIFTQEIFITGRRRNATTPVFDSLKYIAGVLLLDIIILILWTVLDPLEWTRMTIREDLFGQPLESQGYCTSDTWMLFASLIGALHLGLMAVASYMCFCARKIPTRYSEHKYLSIAIISNLQIFVIGVPVLFLVADDPSSKLFVRSVVVWMNDIVVLSLIFGNMMYSVYTTAKNGGGSTDGSKAEIGLAVRRYSSGRSPSIASRGIPQNSPKNADPAAESSITDASIAKSKPADNNPQTMPPKSPRPPRISSLSLESESAHAGSDGPPTLPQPEPPKKRSVSFSDNVTVSEIPMSEYEYEEDDGSQRFATKVIQGAPLKPRRPSSDETPIQSSQQLNAVQLLTNVSELSFGSPPNSSHRRRHSFDSPQPFEMDVSRDQDEPDSPSDRPWNTGPVQNSPFKPRRRTLEDFTMLQPTRQPSEYFEDSESTCGDEIARKANKQQLYIPNMPLATPPSLLHTTAAVDFEKRKSPLAVATDSKFPLASIQSSGQASSQVAVSLGTASETSQTDSRSENFPRQPIRLVSIAELASDCSSVDTMEEPKLVAAQSGGTKGGASGCDRVQGAPTKPEREISSTDLESGESSDDDTVKSQEPPQSRVWSKGAVVTLTPPSWGTPNKPTSSFSTDSIASKDYHWMEAPALARDTSKDSRVSTCSEQVQGAPTKPLRFVSSTDLDLESVGSNSEDSEQKVSAQPQLARECSRGSRSTESGGSSEQAPTKPLRIESSFEVESTARTMDDSSTTDSDRRQLRKLKFKDTVNK
ncbi:acid type B receptor subunit 2 [Seminavis robusta]|uniref:Acid type B receptor subunit 2 n=1 Tax=Seminavis robusta TaxID=568900 RepID=A0A9N8HV32_9STRA|nr:acid type B receptor subunit 2 [Seminavis robusta]|eukprot:Sro1734_g294310.1 acid type B receptor subunit 2 (1142) ;mRNA; f:13326-17519